MRCPKEKATRGQQDPVTILVMPLHGRGRADWAVIRPAQRTTEFNVQSKEKKTHIDDQGLWCNAMDSLLSRRELIVLSSLLLSLGLATSDALQSCQ